MDLQTQEIAQIIKIGTTIMLMGACFVIGMVVYLHKKMLKISN